MSGGTKQTVDVASGIAQWFTFLRKAAPPTFDPGTIASRMIALLDSKPPNEQALLKMLTAKAEIAQFLESEVDHYLALNANHLFEEDLPPYAQEQMSQLSGSMWNYRFSRWSDMETGTTVYLTLQRLVSSEAIFSTINGATGRCFCRNTIVQAEDRIALVMGSDFPLVLRPIGAEGLYNFVGPAYVPTLAEGRAWPADLDTDTLSEFCLV